MFADKLLAWQRAAAHFLQVVEGVPYTLRTEPGACGVWNVQQVVAHLAGWQREALRRYGDFQAGAWESRTYDLDAFNAESVAALKLFGWHDVLETFRFTRDDLLAAAQRLTPQQLEQTPLYAEWLDGIGGDLSAHTQEIQTWLAAHNDETEQSS